MVDMSVNLGGLKLTSPIVTASGTFGYGSEYLGAVDYAKLGAITAKGICVEPWPGNAMPRHCEVPGGLVNAIGLQGTGVDYFLKAIVPWYREKVKVPMIANIWGRSIDEYAEVARRMGDAVDALEMNVSCPNVKAGGHTFGQDPMVLEEVVRAVRKANEKIPLIVKLTPNVPSIVPYVKACENAGADVLSMINTLPAMVVDVEKRCPVIANTTGGLSGRGIHPAAVKVVYDARRATKLPILAMGGVYEARDALEFLLVGADAVAIGTALFTNPKVVGEVYDGIVDYCERHGFSGLCELKI